MVQAPLVGAADVHAGADAHGFQPLQDLDVFSCVVGIGLLLHNLLSQTRLYYSRPQFWRRCGGFWRSTPVVPPLFVTALKEDVAARLPWTQSPPPSLDRPDKSDPKNTNRGVVNEV